MNDAYTIFSAKDAQARFGELLDEAQRRPVAITKHDKPTAYVLSTRDFEVMKEKIQHLEDQLWLSKADLARKEGFVSREYADALLADARMLGHEGV